MTKARKALLMAFGILVTACMYRLAEYCVTQDWSRETLLVLIPGTFMVFGVFGTIGILLSPGVLLLTEEDIID